MLTDTALRNLKPQASSLKPKENIHAMRGCALNDFPFEVIPFTSSNTIHSEANGHGTD